MGAGGAGDCYEAKARAELEAADALVPGADVVAWRGDVLGRVMLVKGLPGPAELESRSAVAGRGGDALAKALLALGQDPAAVFSTVSRPAEAPPDAVAARLRLQIEAVDPQVVLALDPAAAEDLSRAVGVRLRELEPARFRGTELLALGDFEASLGDEDRKRAVWHALKALQSFSDGTARHR